MCKLLLLFLLQLLMLVNSQIESIPITLYRENYGAVAPGQVILYEVKPCLSSCAYFSWARLTISLPSNANWYSNRPLVFVEASKCKGVFTSECVFATNYEYNLENYFSTVVWDWTKYLDNTGTFYLRFTAIYASVEFSFQIQFEQSGNTDSGSYDFQAFRNAESNGVYNRLGQYMMIPATSVKNFETKSFLVEFCLQDWGPECNRKDFTIIATVMQSPEKPMSQFNLYACPANYGTECDRSTAPLSDESAVGVAQLRIVNSGSFNATRGVVVVVYGIGGESNGVNEFKLTATLINN